MLFMFWVDWDVSLCCMFRTNLNCVHLDEGYTCLSWGLCIHWHHLLVLVECLLSTNLQMHSMGSFVLQRVQILSTSCPAIDSSVFFASKGLVLQVMKEIWFMMREGEQSKQESQKQCELISCGHCFLPDVSHDIDVWHCIAAFMSRQLKNFTSSLRS